LQTFSHVRKTLKFVARHNPIQAAQIRRLSVQGTLYVLAYFISYGPQLVIRILAAILDFGRADEPSIYWLLVLNSICYPLQGYLNMFVYSRPNFLRLRAADMPFWKAVRIACFEPDISIYMGRENALLRIRPSVHYDSSEEMEKYHSRVEVIHENHKDSVSHLLSQEFKDAIAKTNMPEIIEFLSGEDDDLGTVGCQTEVIDSSEEARS